MLFNELLMRLFDLKHSLRMFALHVEKQGDKSPADNDKNN
jgi:hypothetical protein